MSWFRKPLFVAAAGLVAMGALAVQGQDGKAANKAEKGKKERKEDKKSREEAAGEKGGNRLSVPVPPGHDAKGLVIPYRDERGNLQMRFTMELGRRTDVEHMAMTKLLIETFDETGDGEMTIDLPESTLDLNSRVITTRSGVTIKRSDFELTGQTMEFNTNTRAGHLGGKVRMLIYNLENETNPAAEAAPDEK